MPPSPDAMAPGKDTEWCSLKKDIPVKRLYRDFEIFKEGYGIRGCVLEGKGKDSLYRPWGTLHVHFFSRMEPHLVQVKWP
jgi:hypothetical protein